MPWVVVQLTDKATDEDPEAVRRSIRWILRGVGAEVFIPASEVTQHGVKAVKYLVDGYMFVRESAKITARHWRLLKTTKYTECAVVVRGSYATVTDAEVDRLRAQIAAASDEGLAPGDYVVATRTCVQHIPCRVLAVYEHEIAIYIQLRSMTRIQHLPREFIQLMRKATPEDPPLIVAARPVPAKPKPKPKPRRVEIQPRAFAMQLRALMSVRKLDTRALASRLHTPRALIMAWRDARALPTDEALLQLAASLGVSADRLSTNDMAVSDGARAPA